MKAILPPKPLPTKQNCLKKGCVGTVDRAQRAGVEDREQEGFWITFIHYGPQTQRKFENQQSVPCWGTCWGTLGLQMPQQGWKWERGAGPRSTQRRKQAWDADPPSLHSTPKAWELAGHPGW